LENHVPHIDVPVTFNQDTSESAHEHHSRLQRKRCAKQCIKSTKPSETSKERSNRVCQEQQTVQQATACAQPSLGNDALQLFRDEDASALGRWDCGKMDTICGFYNAKCGSKNDWQS